MYMHTSTFFMMLLFSVLNWHLEVLKWKALVKTMRNISYSEALKQSLAGHTTAIVTPNKLGEYGAKAYFYKNDNPKKIMGLNFIANAHQLLATLFFGSFGLYYYLQQHAQLPFHSQSVIVFYGAFIFLGSVFILKTKSGKKFLYHFREIGLKTHLLTALYAHIRYIVFSTQFFLILNSFEPEIAYLQVAPVIWCMYLIASFIPTFSIIDFAIKGSVALLLFSSFPVEEFSIISSALLMWAFNFGIPAFLGMYFISRARPYKRTSI